MSRINSKTTQELRGEPRTVYPLDGDNKDGDHSWTYIYSVARVIEVTAWQSADSICHCCRTHGFCH